MSEDIRPVPFAPGYFVSSEGHVYSEKYGTRRRMKPWRNGAMGHLMIGFCIGGKVIRVLVHRVVCTVFNGQAPTPRHEARHMDGDPRNNMPTNLEWGTHAENMADMVRHGRQGPTHRPERMARGDRHGSKTHPHRVCRGERSPMAKLTEEQVRAIRTRTDARDYQLAREYGITQQAVFRIKRRLCWKHVE